MLFALTLLLISGGQFSSSPTVPKLPEHPRTLEISRETKLGVPGFGYWGWPKSSEDGHLFFNIDEPTSMASAVLELAPSSSDAKKYSLPPDVANKYNFVKFSVTPSGAVWFLTCRKDALDVHAMEIDSDGELGADLKLHLPRGLEPTDFLALEDGRFVIVGFYNEQATEDKRGQPFSRIFDKNGDATGGFKFRKGEKLPEVDLAKIRSGPHNGALVQGSDGTLYLLNGTRIYLINPAGEITREIKFDVPADNLVPVNLSVSGNLVAVWLSKEDKEHQVSFNFLLIDLTNREVIGWYEPDPKGTNNMVVGFSREQGFLFLQKIGADWNLVTEQRK
jgi:hypothetical protein